MSGSLLAELTMGLCGTLPEQSMRFFTATPEFWKALQQYHSCIFIEFGCGRGDTVKEAQAKGFRWAGCDPRAQPPQILDSIHCFPAQRFPLAPGMIAITCRPDHTGWVEDSLQRALNNNCTAIYVGLDRNYERDLFDLRGRHEEKILDVGAEGEHMWIWHP